MSFASQAKIRLCIPLDEAWLQDKTQAKNALLMHLEEYMHQYQARSNKFLSSETKAFKAQSPLKDIAETRAIDGADFDEIDVMAMIMDQGFDAKETGFVGRYDERKAFFDWKQAKDKKEEKSL